ncbi:MAG: transposase [Tissierellaceae bacterium]
MPRRPRVVSNTGIYHVMVRGINKMDIFKTPGEKEKYLDTLARMKEEGEYSLYGYCIMDNHAHLLIKEEEDTIDRIMKRIGVSYAYYYNKKYERIGPLFQGRYRSERVESEDYLLACLRYIHNNPVKANVTAAPAAYPWSSYNSYISRYLKEGDIISREFILDIISEDRPKAIKQLIEYTKLYDDYVFLDDEPDKDHKEIIDNILSKYNLELRELRTMKHREMRDMLIRKIVRDTGLSARELSSITGISRATIGRVLN